MMEPDGDAEGNRKAAEPDKKTGKFRCNVENCDYTNDDIVNLNRHMRARHNIRIGWDDGTKSSSKSGGSMSGSGSDDDTDELPRGKKWEVQGKARLLLGKIYDLSPEHQKKLIVERNMLERYTMELRKNLGPDAILEIEMDIEGGLSAAIDHFYDDKGLDIVHDKVKDKKAHMDLEDDIDLLRNEIIRMLSKIAKAPPSKKDALSSDELNLQSLAKKIAKSDLDADEVRYIDMMLNSRIKPSYEAIMASDSVPTITPGNPGAPKDTESLDKMMESEMKQAEWDAKMERYRQQKMESRIMNQKLIDSMGGGNQPKNQMVPMPVAKTESDGSPALDESGNQIYETRFVSSASMDPAMLMLMQSMNKGNSSETIALINTLGKIVENTAKGDKGNDSMEFLKLMMAQNDANMKMIMAMMESNKGQGEPESVKLMREELRHQREESAKSREGMVQFQMSYLTEKLERAESYARRDTLGELMQEKERLIGLGLAKEPNAGEETAETAALRESTKVMNKGLDELRGLGHDLKELLVPAVKAQAEVIRSTAAMQGGQPQRGARPQMSEEEKVRQWRKLAEALEAEEGE